MIYRKNEPKNIFEEIYEAEMSAAETNCTIENVNSQTKQKTPLSNTDYFNGTEAEMNDKGGGLRIRAVKESPKEGSPYTLITESVTYIRTKSVFGNLFGKVDLTQNNVEIGIVSSYRGVELEIYYRYLLSSDGDSENDFSNIPQNEGLYISITGSSEERILTNLEGFSAYGIQEGVNSNVMTLGNMNLSGMKWLKSKVMYLQNNK
jgi:hypothetical protein